MAEDGLEWSTALSGLLDALDDGALAVDAEGTVSAANDAAVAALAPGRDPAGVRGQPVDALLDGVDLPAPGETVTLAGAKDHRTYEARVSAAAERGAGVDRLVVLRDVTGYVQEARRLGALARVLRHAMRDEMTGVLGRAEYVRDAIEEASVLSEARRAADAVVEATRELAELGETAWAVEKVFGEGGPEKVEQDLVPLVEAVVATVEEDHPDVKFETDLPPSAPAVAASSLESALEGVLADACERNDAPVPRVDVSVDNDGDTVSVAVAANGSGVDDELRRVIETGEGTALQMGSNLDLWLAHWVVDAAGGDVTVGDNVPRGTVVTIELPAAE
jgi:signal transduction histidine kinase